MCTHWGLCYGPGKRAIVTATSPLILPVVSGYIQGARLGEKHLSLPLQRTYLEVMGSNPVTGKKISNEIQLLA